MDSLTLWIVATGALVASACGIVGCFLVLRKMALLGDAISHTVLLGIVLAFLLTGSKAVVPMLVGAAVCGILTALAVQLLHQTGVRSDAAIGVTFTALFAVGVVLISLYAGSVHLDVEHALYGEIAYVPWDTWEWRGISMGPRAVWMIGAVLLLDLAVIGLFFKELKVCAFDPGLAVALGIPVTALHYVLMTLVSVTTVASFESVGAVLAVAMLIVPGATAYLLTDRLGAMLAVAAGVGVLAAAGGYGLAIWVNGSISGAMAVVAGLLFLTALIFSPRHGLAARWVRRAATTEERAG